jgi:G3E family GTPase
MATIPTTLVTGALGVGKTTAILSALSLRPEGERWAVLVNEFGEIGIDGALLSDSGGLEVREIAGGCICCTANVPLRLGLARLAREVRPDRLFVEPTGLAHPATVIDVVRSPGLREALDLRATIGLVDPRRFVRGDHDPLYADQVRAADVLVGNFADRLDDQVLAQFRARAEALEPPPVAVATVAHGAFDPAWLTLETAADERRALVSALPHGPHAAELGWVWPPERWFRVPALQELLQGLVRPGALLPEGVLRLKGLFRTDRGFLSVQAGPDEIRFEPIGWRRDSRVSILVAVPPERPEALAEAFEAIAQR